MPEEQEQNMEANEIQEETIEITDEMTRDLVKEILELERDNLYVNRANLKEQIATLVRTKVR
jgi:flagellar motility protein MotE (MotC chaperone)